MIMEDWRSSNCLTTNGYEHYANYNGRSSWGGRTNRSSHFRSNSRSSSRPNSRRGSNDYGPNNEFIGMAMASNSRPNNPIRKTYVSNNECRFCLPSLTVCCCCCCFVVVCYRLCVVWRLDTNRFFFIVFFFLSQELASGMNCALILWLTHMISW